MRILIIILMIIAAIDRPSAYSQQLAERESEFMDLPPLVGDPLPSVSIYSANGDEFNTESLRGHYTVLTFGCLTCPPSMWNIAGLEAVQRDYGPKNVKFFFIYKALAHPELAGNYVQPFTLEERLKHAAQAKQQLGTEIPWLVDAMDNRLKRALGDRPNSQFIIDPTGTIISKRAWSHPGLVRKVLEEKVGPFEKITEVEDLNLKLGQFVESTAPRGLVERIPRAEMKALTMEPQLSQNTLPFYAKLRAEASDELLKQGSGALYLGFHIDPFLSAHWNNLTEPLAVSIECAESVVMDRRHAVAAKIKAPQDADPREFLFQVKSWPKTEPIQITVTYHACVGENCHAVKQNYTVWRDRTVDGGGARGSGAGYWDADEFTARILASDSDGDRRIKESEAPGVIAPHFSSLDKNKDGELDPKELSVVADWLNHHHQPSPPKQ